MDTEPKTLRLVLGDQLSPRLSSLDDFQDGDVVLMAELADEASYANHHKKKIAFIFSAMRHYAETLRQSGKKLITLPILMRVTRAALKVK